MADKSVTDYMRDVTEVVHKMAASLEELESGPSKAAAIRILAVMYGMEAKEQS